MYGRVKMRFIQEYIYLLIIKFALGTREHSTITLIYRGSLKKKNKNCTRFYFFMIRTTNLLF